MRRVLSASLPILLLGLAAVGCTAPAPAPEPTPAADVHRIQPDPRTRAAMHQIFEAMVYLLPRSIDAERFASAEEREGIRARLDVLADSSERLLAHAHSRDPAFAHMSRELERDVEATRSRFAEGRTEEARYLLVGSIQDCVDCHSRVPAARPFPMAERLTEHEDLADLLPHERAQILVVTRRFDEALDTWEQLFANTTVPAREMDAAGVFVDYLDIALRAQGDLARARGAVETLERRPDVGNYLGDEFLAWRAALQELEAEEGAERADAPVKPERALARARELANRGAPRRTWPATHRGLIYDLVASHLLYGILATERTVSDADPTLLAETHYLLGLIETRSEDPSWAPRAESHLEAAIRLDPRGPFAEKSYALLEATSALAYGGARSDLLPQDVGERLRELRALLDAER